MRKYFLSFLFILISLVSFGQTQEQNEIIDDLQTILQGKNYDAIIDKTFFPKNIDLTQTNREAMKKLLIKGLDNDIFHIETIIPERDKFQFSEIFKNDKGDEFICISYPYEAKVIFNKKNIIKKFEDNIKQIFINKGYETQLHENILEIHSPRQVMVGIKNDRTNGVWRYKNYEELNVEVYPDFTEDIFRQITNYYHQK